MVSPRRELLDALSEGPQTEASLTDRVGISAAELSELITTLRDAGFEIQEDTAGYQIRSIPEYGLGIEYNLHASFAIEYHEEIASTNDRARELARQGQAEIVVLAGEQTGGRGRRDRSWHSPPGGVYCTILTRPRLPPDRVGLLTLAAAVAIVEAADAAGVETVIKWPNDVLTAADERKIAGILTESATSGTGTVSWVLVGIGVNANLDETALPDGAASLQARAGTINRRTFVQTLLDTFDNLRTNPSTIPSAWRTHAATLGRDVQVVTDTDTISGRAVDITDSGALKLDTGDQIRTVAAGECQHLSTP